MIEKIIFLKARRIFSCGSESAIRCRRRKNTTGR